MPRLVLGRRTPWLLALVAGSAPLVQCTSDDGATHVTFPVADAMVRGAGPVAVTHEGFRLGGVAPRAAAAGPSRWTHTPSPRVEIARAAGSTMWITAAAGEAPVGIVHEGLTEAAPRLEGTSVVRFDGDDASARLFARGSEVEEIVYLEEPAPIRYRWVLPAGDHVRSVPTGGGTSMIEVDDARGRPTLRMRADEAWDARGRTLAVTTTLEGDVVRVALDPAERDVVYPVAVDPSWFSALSPIRIRAGHTATLLGSGHVLLAGGDTAAASSELFDSANPTFFPDSTMVAKRTHHTATLLQSGHVLLAGGDGLASAELYDPLSLSFKATGSLSMVRAGHTAVRLPSGKVMIVGGAGSSDTSTEIYDEATGKFTLAAPRDAIAAGGGALVVLPSGKVLFSGHGSATQVFDPAANGGLGSWTTASVPPLPSMGYRDGVLLRDGTVLVTGGYTCGTTGTPVNCGSHGDLFDPSAGGGLGQATGSTPDLPGPGATATMLPTGQVLFTGGGVPTTDAAIYDPASNTVTKETMTSSHSEHTATVLPTGDVMVVGGSQAGVDLRPATGKLVAVPGPMVTGRTNHSAVRLRDGRVLLVGGLSQNGIVATAEIFDPSTATFTATGPMNEPRLRPVLSVLPTGDVLVTGGSNTTNVLASAEIYDVAGGSFRSIASMATARSEHAVTLMPSGELFVTGGCSQASTIPGCSANAMLSATEIFDPKVETFRPGPALLTGHADHGVVRLPTGNLLVVGGTDAEIYDTVIGFFRAVPSPGGVRDGRTAHLLVSGKVFLSGGATLAAELFDPATEQWSFAGTVPFSDTDVVWSGTVEGRVVSSGGRLFEGVEQRGMLFDPNTLTGDGLVAYTGTGRASQTATLMVDGGLLITGGDPCWGNCVGYPLATAAIWSDGAAASVRPVITSAPSSIAGGVQSTLDGHGFTGTGEGSSGNTYASALDAPQVVWLSESGDAVVRATVLDFTDTHIDWFVPATALAGHGFLYVLVGGVTSKGAPSVMQRAVQADSCTYDGQCASGFCTDGVCCDTRCNGKCEGCSADRKTTGPSGVCGAVPFGKGQCFALQGQACTDASQCATGFCTEGVCCDSGCKGTCLSCTQAGHVGSCSAISEGACDVACDGAHTLKKVGSPDVDCAPYTCDGKSCRNTCASARDCVGPAVCNAAGLCVPPIEASPSTASVWGCSATAREKGPLGDLEFALALGAASALALRRRRRTS